MCVAFFYFQGHGPQFSWRFFCGSMAAALEKQILASQKFLGTVRHLPSFAEARDKQVENLLKKISKSPFQVEQAAALVELLDDSIWGSHVDALKSAATLDDASARKNAPLQDYLALPHYLTAGLWKSLAEDNRSVALEKLCRHCRRLGLTNASEVSQAMILLLVFDLEGKMLGSQQWQVTVREKGKVLKFLKQNISQSQLPHVLVLPQCREECPQDLVTRAVGSDSLIDCQWPYEDLLTRAKDWPMRSTHRFAQGGVAPTSSLLPAALPHAGGAEVMQQMGKFMAGFLQAQKPTEEVPLPGLKIAAKAVAKPAPAASTQPALLALEDKRDDVPAQGESIPSTTEAPPTGKGAVAATLAALQQDVRTEARTTQKSVLKRPAKATKVTMKRPAACLRRPAAVASKVVGETREDRRLRLIRERVPQDMQRRYRDGCSTCYYRKGCTLSCWTKRGYDMTD